MVETEETPVNSRVRLIMHLEFVVPGPPISGQSPGVSLNLWKAAVQAAVKARWSLSTLEGQLKAIIINFHEGAGPSVDVDNMTKPILDVMQDLVYNDDRQITQAEISHVRIDAAFRIAGTPWILVGAIQAGTQFVYVRIDDPVVPFPLPK
jgi:hypothetical protein